MADPLPDPVRWLGRGIGIAILAGAVLAAWHVTRLNFESPRTDDATVQANTVGIAPHISGPLLELKVDDNQEVKEGDVLFVIDSGPYEAALAGAQAALLLAQSELMAMSNSVQFAGAGIELRKAELSYAQDEVKRLEPLLKERAVEADAVDMARMRERTAEAALRQSRQDLERQQNLLGQHGPLNARLGAAEASVRAASLNVEYCTVRAPFKGRVVNLNISAGQYATEGAPLLRLVDTREWYVMANYRETFLKSIQPGFEAEVFLMSYPNQRFRGRVEGIAWAVAPVDAEALGALPRAAPSLNWVRLAQRIPVRIRLQEPLPNQPFRMGMSAVVTVRQPSGGGVGASDRAR